MSLNDTFSVDIKAKLHHRIWFFLKKVLKDLIKCDVPREKGEEAGGKEVSVTFGFPFITIRKKRLRRCDFSLNGTGSPFPVERHIFCFVLSFVTFHRKRELRGVKKMHSSSDVFSVVMKGKPKITEISLPPASAPFPVECHNFRFS